MSFYIYHLLQLISPNTSNLIRASSTFTLQLIRLSPNFVKLRVEKWLLGTKIIPESKAMQ